VEGDTMQQQIVLWQVVKRHRPRLDSRKGLCLG